MRATSSGGNPDRLQARLLVIGFVGDSSNNGGLYIRIHYYNHYLIVNTLFIIKFYLIVVLKWIVWVL